MLDLGSKSILLTLGLLLPALCGDALRPSQAISATPVIAVVGSGEVRAFPNQADVVLQAEAVQARVKASMDQVQAAIRGAFAVCAKYASDSGDLTAGQISVEKEYRWAKNTQVFKGYRCNQTLTLRLKDLNRLGELMEEISVGKITRINGIEYSHSAIDSLERAAEAIALIHARLSAAALGKGSGAAVGEVLFVGNQPLAESCLGNGYDKLSLGASRAGYEPAKAKAEYLVKPDLIVVTGTVYATFALRYPK